MVSLLQTAQLQGFKLRPQEEGNPLNPPYQEDFNAQIGVGNPSYKTKETHLVFGLMRSVGRKLTVLGFAITIYMN